MFSKLTSLVLVTAIFSSATVVSAISPRTGNEKDAEKVKTEIRQLGIGPDAQIKLKLRDKTNLEGYVSEANENNFTVVDPKTGTATTVAYPQVGQTRGNNLSGGLKIALTIAVVAALTYLTFKYGRRNRRYGF